MKQLKTLVRAHHRPKRSLWSWYERAFSKSSKDMCACSIGGKGEDEKTLFCLKLRYSSSKRYMKVLNTKVNVR